MVLIRCRPRQFWRTLRRAAAAGAAAVLAAFAGAPPAAASIWLQTSTVGHAAPIMRLAADAGRDLVVTASDDKTARIWHVTVPGLKEALRRATTDCLTSEQRGVYLLEATAAAQVEYAACERSHGRTAPALGSSVDRPPTPTR